MNIVPSILVVSVLLSGVPLGALAAQPAAQSVQWVVGSHGGSRESGEHSGEGERGGSACQS